MLFGARKIGQLGFSEKQQQLVNSGNDVSFAKTNSATLTFSHFDIQLKNLNRPNCDHDSFT